MEEHGLPRQPTPQQYALLEKAESKKQRENRWNRKLPMAEQLWRSIFRDREFLFFSDWWNIDY